MKEYRVVSCGVKNCLSGFDQSPLSRLWCCSRYYLDKEVSEELHTSYVARGDRPPRGLNMRLLLSFSSLKQIVTVDSTPPVVDWTWNGRNGSTRVCYSANTGYSFLRDNAHDRQDRAVGSFVEMQSQNAHSRVLINKTAVACWKNSILPSFRETGWKQIHHEAFPADLWPSSIAAVSTGRWSFSRRGSRNSADAFCPASKVKLVTATTPRLLVMFGVVD